MQTKREALAKLRRSRFRSSFHLSEEDKAYVRKKGMAVIRSHAEDFVRQKLAPAEPYHDGKQTPMHGHPVFLAMHACGMCCRGCLSRWYHVPRGQALSERQIQQIVNMLLFWIESEMDAPEDGSAGRKEGESDGCESV